MKLFNIINRGNTTGQLVNRGLVKEHRISEEAVEDCIYLMATTLGDQWDSIETESAAGMALVTLAKNASLYDRLSAKGWDLVSGFVAKYPSWITSISPRARIEIETYELGYCRLASAA